MYVIDQQQCQAAGNCLQACPIEAIVKHQDGKYEVKEDCTDCAACEDACDHKAVQRQ